MFRLSRQVRFGVITPDDGQLAQPPSNSFGGFPSLRGVGEYLVLDVTLQGDLQPGLGYMLNIKEIDHVVRREAIPMASDLVRSGHAGTGTGLLTRLFEQLKNAWPGQELYRLGIFFSPYFELHTLAQEFPMVRLSQKFEFCAAHRLHNPALGDSENRRLFGKCNNPNGHGHNYVVQITLAGKPNESGLLIDVPAFEQIVAAAVIEPFDHKNLNVEIPEFADLIPSVENIAMVIFNRLKPKLQTRDVRLAGVTVHESTKTWCEYAE